MKKISVICFFDNNGSSAIQRSIVKEIEGEFNNIEFKTILGDDGEAVKKYDIKEIPSILIEVDGEIKERFSGFTQQLFLRRALEKLIK